MKDFESPLENKKTPHHPDGSRSIKFYAGDEQEKISLV